MKPSSHAAISLTTSLLIYIWLRSLEASIICFLSGIFFDLDHLPEYLSLKKHMKYFYSFDLAKKKERIYIIFHSLELLFLLWLIILIWKLNLLWTVFALSISIHLVSDLVGNPIRSPFTYFLIYRLIKGFKSHHLFKEYQ